MRKFTGILQGLLWMSVCLLAWAVPAGAQERLAQEQPAQYVDSLEGHQSRIESLIGERLANLLPRKQYVLRAYVTGEKVRVSIGGGVTPRLDLPGFRISPGEALAGEEKFRVDKIVVRIVLNPPVHPVNRQYLRTIIPILAEFREERGDELNLEVIDPEAAGLAAGEFPDFPQTPFGKAEPQGLAGLPWWAWVIIGVGGVMALLVMILLLRLIFAGRPKAETPQPVAPPPPLAAEPREDKGAIERERQQMEQERELNALRHSVVKRMFSRPELGQDLIADWQSSAPKLTALIHAVGPSIAREAVMPHMGQEQYQDIEETVLKGQPPDISRQLNAMRDANLFLISREISNPEILRANPFRFLDSMNWGQINQLVKAEPVRVKAIVLSRIDSEDSARIMDNLPREVQLEIAVEIGNLHDLPLDMAESVAMDLAIKARNVPDAKIVEVEGPMALVDVMGHTSSETTHYLLGAMKSKDTKLSQEVEKRFFLFEAIPLVPDDIMPQAVRTMPSNTVVTALQGAPEEIQRKVIMAFPENSRTGLVTALKASRANPELVAEARRRVVAQFQDLGKQGRIDLKQISDVWQGQAKAS